MWTALLLVGSLAAFSTSGPSSQGDTFVEDFDVLWSAVRSRYAYLDREDVRWSDAERDLWRTKAAEVEGEGAFLDLIEQVLEGLRDHHVHMGLNSARSSRLVPSQTDLWLEWVGGEAMVTSVRSGSDAARAGVSPGDVVLALRGEPVMDLVLRRLGLRPERGLADVAPNAANWALRVEVAGRWNQPRTLDMEGPSGRRTLTLGEQWGPAREGLLHVETIENGKRSVGYVRMHDSLGNAETVLAFDGVLRELLETEALILDLRETPGGGNSTVARGVLGHFVTFPSSYQRHVLPAEGAATGVPRSWIEEVWPRAPFYPGRVVVLVGRWTGSMGEGLAMGFDANNALVLGEPMAGLLGALVEVRLPNTGWAVRFANEVLTHVDGTPREQWVPQRVVRDERPGDAVDEVLEAALDMLRSQ